MKKHVLLTSLVAIGLSYGAHAATTDVSFSGNYTQSDGTTANVADALQGTTYDYTKSDGTKAEGVAYDQDPNLSDFTYTDKDGAQKSLNDGTPTQSDYTAGSAADGDKVRGPGNVTSGDTLSEDMYEFKIGNDEYRSLADGPMSFSETFTSGDDAEFPIDVTVTDGKTTFDGTMYDLGDGYTLSADGTGVVDAEGNSVTVTDLGPEFTGKFNRAKRQYANDKQQVEALQESTGTSYTNANEAYTEAQNAFEADQQKLTDLNDRFDTVGAATKAFDDAKDAQSAAKDAYDVNDSLLQAAKDLFDAPIEDTITNGANDAIDKSLGEGGKISDAIDSAVSNEAAARDAAVANEAAERDAAVANEAQERDKAVANEAAARDAADQAEAAARDAADQLIREDFAAADAALSARIDTNTQAITDNKTAIESETARAQSAEAELDGKIAQEVKDRIAGDEMTLAQAKAYADAKNETALKSAKDYTDKKVSAVEKELSAGIAAATAMSSIEVSNVAKGEVSVGGGYGYYNSQSAVAFGAAMGLTDKWSVNAAAGIADSNVSFRAGTNYKFKLF